jgi:hypothetical protein
MGREIDQVVMQWANRLSRKKGLRTREGEAGTYRPALVQTQLVHGFSSILPYLRIDIHPDQRPRKHLIEQALGKGIPRLVTAGSSGLFECLLVHHVCQLFWRFFVLETCELSLTGASASAPPRKAWVLR